MIQVFDSFVADPQRCRDSATRSGFGTWRPNKGDTGADFYDGVNVMGCDHAPLQVALYKALRRQIIVTSMFYRITNPMMERARIHSDREYGENTAIVYLSPNTHMGSGTGFYRHKETGMTDMPPLQDLMKDQAAFQRLNQQMVESSDRDWQMYRFVEAKYNRCLVFDAPKIHCRLPKSGYGTNDNDSRMVWVCHFNLAE